MRKSKEPIWRNPLTFCKLRLREWIEVEVFEMFEEVGQCEELILSCVVWVVTVSLRRQRRRLNDAIAHTEKAMYQVLFCFLIIKKVQFCSHTSKVTGHCFQTNRK